MGSWGPGEKRLTDGNIMTIRDRFIIWTGDTLWHGECTDGWVGQEFTDYKDAEKDYGEHHGKQHGGNSAASKRRLLR